MFCRLGNVFWYLSRWLRSYPLAVLDGACKCRSWFWQNELEVENHQFSSFSIEKYRKYLRDGVFPICKCGIFQCQVCLQTCTVRDERIYDCYSQATRNWVRLSYFALLVVFFNDFFFKYIFPRHVGIQKVSTGWSSPHRRVWWYDDKTISEYIAIWYTYICLYILIQVSVNYIHIIHILSEAGSRMRHRYVFGELDSKFAEIGKDLAACSSKVLATVVISWWILWALHCKGHTNMYAMYVSNVCYVMLCYVMLCYVMYLCLLYCM